tara:strand:+ start:1458 stop:2798 length:1341 start_codon:yes stop_codon:yes gene_type:complete
MEKNKILIGKRAFFVLIVVSLFFAALLQVSSEEKVKISDLEKEEINEDDGSQELLKEYYGNLLGYVGTDTKFNTIATKDNIAVINITVNGRDRRILTKLHTGDVLAPQQQDLANVKFIRTESLVVLGNISLKGMLFSEVDGVFGSRKLYAVESTTLRYADEGVSRLVDGEAKVSINPALSSLISSYNVFLSAYGLTKGLYVAEKNNAYFVVKSVNPESNVAFSWMLSGLRAGYDEGYLTSLYGVEKGISVVATIDYENESTYVKISGLQEILALIEETVEEVVINDSNNNESNNNQTNNDNSNNNGNDDPGIKLITGNLVDEFGLETDLGQILSETAPELPTIGDENSNNNNGNDNPTNNNPNNNSTQTNETEDVISTLEFTLFSVDEDVIVEQISSVTGLSSAEVRKLVSFVYTEPQVFLDEVIDTEVELDYIQKVNGSVIIKLG